MFKKIKYLINYNDKCGKKSWYVSLIKVCKPIYNLRVGGSGHLVRKK